MNMEIAYKRQRNILIIVILLLIFGVGFGLNKINKLQTELTISNVNNQALSDTIEITKNKVGEIEYSKGLLIAEKNDLKSLNEDLSKELKKERGKVRELNKIVSQIKSDTIVIDNVLMVFDSGHYGLEWKYDTVFNEDNSRKIIGMTEFQINDSGKVVPMQTTINTDEIKFNLITGIKENKGKIEIFARSDYPGLTVSKLDGAIIDPKKHPVIKKLTKKKKYSVGVNVSYSLGADFKFYPTIGIGVQYSIIRF